MSYAAWLLLALLGASRLNAQDSTPKPEIDAWASATLGGASLRGSPNSGDIAGQLALWMANDHRLFGLRAAGAEPFFENGTSLSDVAFLAGLRATSSSEPSSIFGGTASFALGPSIMHGTASVEYPRRDIGPTVALGYSAEGTLHLRVIGVGMTAFGAVGARDMFSAVGVTLSLGKIH